LPVPWRWLVSPLVFLSPPTPTSVITWIISEFSYLLLLEVQTAVSFRTQWKPPARIYSGADKSLPLPTSQCILFDGENILFDASLVIYINSTNISRIIIINRIAGNHNLLLL
jgi:hypothetical protein